MNLIEIAAIAGNENDSRTYWKSLREQQGIVCKKCGGKNHHWLHINEEWSCNSCDFRTSLKSGTIMENSKLPYHYWLHAIYMILSTKKGVSALAIQRQLGSKRYEPIWFMCQKIRLTMGSRDNSYDLNGDVEMDEAFITVMENIEDRPEKNPDGDTPPLSRGRGSERKQSIAVMAATEKRKLKNGTSRTCLKYLKIKLLFDCQAETIREMVQKHINPNSTLLTDGHPSYKKLGKEVARHVATVCPPKLASKVLPVVHLAISNLKRKLNGIHHCISRGYLQCYLDEFCYKINRNWAGLQLFERFVNIAVQRSWASCG